MTERATEREGGKSTCVDIDVAGAGNESAKYFNLCENVVQTNKSTITNSNNKNINKYCTFYIDTHTHTHTTSFICGNLVKMDKVNAAQRMRALKNKTNKKAQHFKDTSKYTKKNRKQTINKTRRCLANLLNAWACDCN